MPDDFPEQFGELLGYFEGSPGARRIPGGRPNPCEVWLLGSSPQSAIWAAELGLPYAFADFINPDGAPLAALYRERFTPDVRLAEPRVAVAGWAVCADTDAEAQALTASWRMLISLLHRGQLIAVPSVEKAQEFLAEYGPNGGGLPLNRRTIGGTPARVKAGIEALAAAYSADEVFLVNILYDHAGRRRSYELIAGAFGL
jgi:luciferase family oxidoreductase group 1